MKLIAYCWLSAWVICCQGTYMLRPSQGYYFRFYQQTRHGCSSALPWRRGISGKAEQSDFVMTIRCLKFSTKEWDPWFAQLLHPGAASPLLWDWPLRPLPHQGPGVPGARRRSPPAGPGATGTPSTRTRPGSGEVMSWVMWCYLKTRIMLSHWHWRSWWSVAAGTETELWSLWRCLVPGPVSGAPCPTC